MSEPCRHNTMVPNDDPDRVWKCAECGYVYGPDPETFDNLRTLPKRYTPAMLADFRNYFGWNLHEFWSPFTGFDIVKFDDRLGTPENVSCRDHLAAKHGDGAVRLIEWLIKI